MTADKWPLLACAGAVLACAACNVDQPAPPRQGAEGNAATAAAAVDHADPMASAMAAAPKAIGEGATIIQAAADGSMKTLRPGTNGWTCMPDNPKTPGRDPMCMDANALRWAQAWMAKKDPPADAVGFMYMLAGGSDASNMDPFGQEPADEQWIETGPHVMVVGSKDIVKGYPSGPKPDTTKPYVMFPDTPYAHLMIPVS